MTSIDKSNMARRKNWLRILQILAFLVPFFPYLEWIKVNTWLYIFQIRSVYSHTTTTWIQNACISLFMCVIQWYTVKYYYTILYILTIVEISCVHSRIGIMFSCILVYSQVYFFKFHDNFKYPMESFFLHICVFNGTLFWNLIKLSCLIVYLMEYICQIVYLR